VDAKADILVYGMAERTILELAEKLKHKESIESIRGICYVSKQKPEPSSNFQGHDIQLPDHAVVVNNKHELARMFATFYEMLTRLQEKDYISGKIPDIWFKIHPIPLSTKELDKIYEMPFARQVHPFYSKYGHVKAT
jgi:radical SAM superfamily enzyme YgiQ (UPF0313 family)